MPPVEAPAITMHTSHPPPSFLLQQAVFKETMRQELSPSASYLHRIICNMRTQFPDLRLIQYDCGMCCLCDTTWDQRGMFRAECLKPEKTV